MDTVDDKVEVRPVTTTYDEAIAAARERFRHAHCLTHGGCEEYPTVGEYNCSELTMQALREKGNCDYALNGYDYQWCQVPTHIATDPLAAAIARLAEAAVLLEAAGDWNIPTGGWGSWRGHTAMLRDFIEEISRHSRRPHDD